MKTEPLAPNDYQGAEVRLCQDGKYRWRYELNMIKNPVIMITVFKIFLYVSLAMILVFGLIFYIQDHNFDGAIMMLKVTGVVLGIFFVLTIISAAILNALFGGSYVARFEMDEHSVKHLQLNEQSNKAQKLGFLTFLVGLFAKRPSVAGAGMLSMAKTPSVSNFKNVRRVRGRRWLHTIKVNQLLDRNQVYVTDEDYDFVLDFIKSHCPNLKH